MKNYIVKNNGTLQFHIVKYLIYVAKNKSMDLFNVWLVEYLIIPYRKEDKILDWISEFVGFKKVPTIDKLYWRLREVEIQS